MAVRKFKTEVADLLHLIIHSLYSNQEIFLRELVSNSSDALDKLKYLTLTDEEMKKLVFEPAINISFTEGEKKTLTISDNGIGMNEEELNKNLGTIASSGTKKFLSSLSDEQKKDSDLIGQFGVGFYSAFMVAEKVEVVTRRAGEKQAYKWSSTGKGSYRIDEAERDEQGTSVTLFLNEDGEQFANRWQIENLIKKYSDNIAFPIKLSYEEKKFDEKGEETGVEQKCEQINSCTALWKRNKSSIKEEEYNNFFKNSFHENGDPLFYVHTKAEGTLQFTTLFYIPEKAPFDMYYADYRPGVKLYVKRVFITDDDKELLPSYLRFVRGVIDSEDLPLNVSREILQQNRVMSSIRSSSVKKLLGEFKKIAENDKELYARFIKEYNRPLKEGLYSDWANREELMELIRFKSSKQDGFVSLAGYKNRMAGDQDAIYYITGGDEKTLKASPLIEAYEKKGYEVLIMDDQIDDLISGAIGTYKEIPLKAINKSGSIDDLSGKDEENSESDSLIEIIKKSLGDKVKDVVASTRLVSSPAIVVVDENAPTVQMQQILKQMGQEVDQVNPILEVNTADPMIQKIAKETDKALCDDMCAVVLDQALLAQGVMPADPVEFAKRVHTLLSR